MPTDRSEELMVQPPYQPPGGTAPGEEDPGAQPWQRPGPYGPPADQYGPPPGPYAFPGQYPQPGPYGQYQGQFGPPSGPAGTPDLYAQPVFGQAWGPGGPAVPEQRRNTLVAVVLAGVAVLAAVGIALFLLLGDDPLGSTAEERRVPPGNGDVPAATVEPDGLGADRLLDELAQSCYDGDMNACDRLYDQSDAGSDYEVYGDTCAGRQPSGTFVYCTETFGD